MIQQTRRRDRNIAKLQLRDQLGGANVFLGLQKHLAFGIEAHIRCADGYFGEFDGLGLGSEAEISSAPIDTNGAFGARYPRESGANVERGIQNLERTVAGKSKPQRTCHRCFEQAQPCQRRTPGGNVAGRDVFDAGPQRRGQIFGPRFDGKRHGRGRTLVPKRVETNPERRAVGGPFQAQIAVRHRPAPMCDLIVQNQRDVLRFDDLKRAQARNCEYLVDLVQKRCRAAADAFDPLGIAEGDFKFALRVSAEADAKPVDRNRLRRNRAAEQRRAVQRDDGARHPGHEAPVSVENPDRRQRDNRRRAFAKRDLQPAQPDPGGRKLGVDLGPQPCRGPVRQLQGLTAQKRDDKAGQDTKAYHCRPKPQNQAPQRVAIS